MSDADPAADHASTTGIALRIRKRIAGWVAVAISLVCFGNATVLTAQALGLAELLPDFRNEALFASAAFLIGCVALAFRGRFAERKGLRVAQALCVALGIVTAWAVPPSYLTHAIPQIIWVPVLIAAATCEFEWIFINAALAHAIILVRVPEAHVFRVPTAWVTSFVIVLLISIVRWLHDAGIEEATDAHTRMTDGLFRDELTGLPNRHRVAAILGDALDARDRGPVAVLRLDIQQFGPISDAVGRDAGDELLRRVAHETSRALPSGTVVARIGADDFIALLPGADSVAAEAAARALVDRFDFPIDLSGRSVRVAPRVGVALVDAGASVDAETVLQRAEQAAALAKRAGRRRLATLTVNGPGDPIERFFLLSQDLHEALPRGELTVVYQPIFDLRMGGMRKAEALVRWNHGALGPVGPGEFIPIAEVNGAIHAIGDWVFQQAVRQAAAWRALGAKDFQISINRSPVQFRDDADGRHPCLQQLDAMGAAADSVVLEITEGVLLDADVSTKERLEQLRSAGMALSLDDFGTGYSSIGQLHSFDLDLVKIDRRFVTGLAPGSKEHVLCESIVLMSHSLGLKVVAEGIETEAQRVLLAGLGCDYGQGYLLGRPMPADQLEALLFRQDTSPASNPTTPVSPQAIGA
jgi:diguanylate cyclase (GGDEF)-like protein